ncbi:MAG: molybdopterin-dependent oxidoreductase [Planctomycetes bacterium]|nr:molybdopterin-dependent oxidoreductase [Planctomycetota bacterium]
MRMTRRDWLWGATAGVGATLLPAGCSRRAVPAAAEPMARFPGKVPMRVVNDRPPCLETPWRSFREDFTPNDAFYVRWHLQAIPTTVDLASWRLRIDGAVDRPLELSMDDLKRLGSDEVVAVNQCSGNSRSLLTPRVSGAQWKNGAMGNARWGGVSLATLLRRAGIKADAVQVTFDGLDEGPLSSVPDFVKALSLDQALQHEVTVTYAMNNEPLPGLNGFPARLVVPGWYATYWVKALHRITVLPKVFDGYWMAKAYKLPSTPNGNEDPRHLAPDLVPISRLNVRSFFTTPDPSATTPAGRPCPLDGIAFDGGSGIRVVEVSADDGRTWVATELGNDLGRFSFRRWRLAWTPPAVGEYRLRVRATNREGQSQPDAAGWNRSGFMRNVVEELPVRVI